MHVGIVGLKKDKKRRARSEEAMSIIDGAAAALCSCAVHAVRGERRARRSYYREKKLIALLAMRML